ARHPDVTLHPRVVAIVAAVGRQIESDGKAHLPRGQVAPVEGVGVLGRGEAPVLADRPRVGEVHGWLRPAQEGREVRKSAESIETGQVSESARGTHRYAFRWHTRRAVRRGRGGRNGVVWQC